MRCWQTVPFECLFPTAPILFMKDTLIYCNQHLFSLPLFTLSLPTFRRPLSLVVVHSSLCDGIIPQITIHTQPAGNSVCIVRITILWSLTDWKLYLLTVVSPHFLLGLEREGLCEYNVQNLCCLYVGFIFLSYRYQGAVYQLRFAPHRVPEEHGAVFLELRSGLRLWLKLFSF